MAKHSLAVSLVVALLLAGVAVVTSQQPEETAGTRWPGDGWGAGDEAETFRHKQVIDALQHLPQGGVLPILVTVESEAKLRIRHAVDLETSGSVICGMHGAYGPVPATFLAALAAGEQPQASDTSGGLGIGFNGGGPWLVVAGNKVGHGDGNGLADASDREFVLWPGRAVVAYVGYDADGGAHGSVTVEVEATQPVRAEPWPVAPLACGYGLDGMEGGAVGTTLGVQAGGTATVAARYGTHAFFSSWAPVASVDAMRDGTLHIDGKAIDLAEAVAHEDDRWSSLSAEPARIEIARWDTAPFWGLAGLWLPVWDRP